MTIIEQNFEIQNQRIIFKGKELPVRPGITPAYLPEVRKPTPPQKKYNFPPDQGGARSFLTTPSSEEEDYLIEMDIA